MQKSAGAVCCPPAGGGLWVAWRGWRGAGSRLPLPLAGLQRGGPCAPRASAPPISPRAPRVRRPPAAAPLHPLPPSSLPLSLPLSLLSSFPPERRSLAGWEEISPEFPFHTSRLKLSFCLAPCSLQLLLSSEMPGQGKGPRAGGPCGGFGDAPGAQSGTGGSGAVPALSLLLSLFMQSAGAGERARVKVKAKAGAEDRVGGVERAQGSGCRLLEPWREPLRGGASSCFPCFSRGERGTF